MVALYEKTDQYLKKRLSGLQRLARQGLPSKEVLMASMGAIDALVELGVITEREGRLWLSRFESAAAEPPFDQEP